MIIIGLQGAAGSGKTTFANWLVFQHEFELYSFADPLKDFCAGAFGWDRKKLDLLTYKEEQDPNLPDGWTRRRVLQHVGTDCFRAIDPEYWINKFRKKMQDENYNAAKRDYVIPDVRFANECEAIWEAGGYIVRLERPGFEGTTANSHASEQEWRSVEPDLTLAPAEGTESVQRAAAAALSLIQAGCLKGPNRPTALLKQDAAEYRAAIQTGRLESDAITRKTNLNDRRVGLVDRRVAFPIYCALERRYGPTERRQS